MVKCNQGFYLRLEESSGLLLELRVRDIGIIGRVDWSLGRGLNVITGETGAGYQ